MKFVCDSCSTKYSIADERVRGRVLKIRCKSCNHVITVREEASQAGPAPGTGRHAQSMGEAIEGSFGPGEERGGDRTVVSTSMPPEFDDGANDEWYVSFDG